MINTLTKKHETIKIFNNHSRKIFIAGGTGYIGRALIPELQKHNHSVQCLVRENSISKLTYGCTPVLGNALNKNSYKEKIYPSDIFIHLVGVSHPNPFKSDQFRKIDLVALQQSVEASVESDIKHFIYLSVAHPAPVMKQYIKVREECEEYLLQSGLNVTILRPWYVIGPGHRWPYMFIPFYKLMELFPSKSESVKRLGLVSLKDMTQTLLDVVENPAEGIEIIEVPNIRSQP